MKYFLIVQFVFVNFKTSSFHSFVTYLVKIEVEVDSLAQLEELLTVGADAVLLDNMAPATLAEAVALVEGRVLHVLAAGPAETEDLSRRCAIPPAPLTVPTPPPMLTPPITQAAIEDGETRVTDSPLLAMCWPALWRPPAPPARNIGMFSIEWILA